MDDIFELPNANVSKLQVQGQGDEPDDGHSSVDEDEGGLDWTKLPSVFQLISSLIQSEPHGWVLGSDPPSLGRSSRSGGTKSMSPHQGRIFKNIILKGPVVRCSTP